MPSALIMYAAITDAISNGNFMTPYTFDPFWNVSMVGTSSSAQIQQDYDVRPAL
jgi:hypothetical protein